MRCQQTEATTMRPGFWKTGPLLLKHGSVQRPGQFSVGRGAVGGQDGWPLTLVLPEIANAHENCEEY
jgi:hypothetical protein